MIKYVSSLKISTFDHPYKLLLCMCTIHNVQYCNSSNHLLSGVKIISQVRYYLYVKFSLQCSTVVYTCMYHKFEVGCPAWHYRFSNLHLNFPIGSLTDIRFASEANNFNWSVRTSTFFHCKNPKPRLSCLRCNFVRSHQ